MELAIITEKAAISHYKVAQDIYNTIRGQVECSLCDWEEKAIPEKNILFVGTLFTNTLHYLSRFTGKNIVFYTTLEGEPLVDPIGRKIASKIKIVAVSRFVKEMLERADLNCEGVVYHGIDMAKTQHDPRFTEFLETIENPKNEPNIRKRKYLTVSGNMERKGLDKLIVAHKIVEYNHPSAILILHTGGGYVDITRMADALQLEPERFWYTNSFGLYDEYQMNSLYRYADFYVQPSHTEGFGLPMIEALKHNKPVIAIDAPPYNEIIENGKTGILIPVKGQKRQLYMNSIYLLMRLYEVDDLARAIEALLDDKLRQSLAQNITPQVKAKFDSKNTYPNLLKYF
jgi:glycosyltransferase involved in cell wall biosynthesis